MRRGGNAGAAAALCALVFLAPACGGAPDTSAAPGGSVRVATFNVEELSTAKLWESDSAGAGSNAQARAAAEIVQRVRPDVLVLQEIDVDYAHPDDLARNARRFAEAYLETGDAPISYPYAYAAPVNTGALTGIDLNGDGHVATEADLGTQRYGEDAYGFGTYPGQYGMAVLSRFPVDSAAARTFQRFRWADLPGNHLPRAFYSPDAVRLLRLSSKSHWDLPIAVVGDTLHLWVSHPTPPAFDGPEDRNGRRNFDEIRFWLLYARGSDVLVDDDGDRGGYGSRAPFVIAGDLNARPGDTTVVYDGVAAADQLLLAPGIRDPGPAATPTATFLGGVRVDYVLLDSTLSPRASRVFAPSPADDASGARLAVDASDHRLVWVDVAWPPRAETAGPKGSAAGRDEEAGR